MRTFTLLIALLSLMLPVQAGQEKELSFDRIETGFHQVPSDVRIAVYWYWLANNMSEEGVIHDLEAMKQAGIGRAYIGFIGMDNIPQGPHQLFSESWWKVVHAALKRASELDIEIGIFNGPGWSQSGGPWVKPEESMRYLDASEMRVQGPTVLNCALPEVAEDAEDVKVIAYPAPAKGNYRQEWHISKKENESATLDIDLTTTDTVRTLTCFMQSPIKTSAALYEKENNNYRLLKQIEIDRSNPALNVGFKPYAPVAVALPNISGKQLRLVIDKPGAGELTFSLSSQAVVERYPEKTLAKMFQTPLPMWSDYMWPASPVVNNAQYVIDPDKVTDLTDSFRDGKLNWKVPQGEWIIQRMAMRPTQVTNAPASPEAVGLEVDKMSRTHVRSHFDAFIGEILRRIPKEDRTSFKVVVQDSYETGGQNWTDDMQEVFKKRYGYDPLPYLPALWGTVVGSAEMSDRFLWDLRRLIADRVAYDYVGGLREVCNRHGLTTWLENYGHWGFPGEFLQYGGQSDEVGGEFWSEGTLGDIENRAASSCAHIYGKKRVWAESFTAGGLGFLRYPAMLKARGDRFFTEGINSTLLHVYVQQPWDDRLPGMAAWFGCEFNRNNTWFSQMDLFTGYLRRCNFLLQQGRYVADVAYYIGEDAPKMTGTCNPALPRGYSYDYINSEILLHQAKVRNGKLVLDSGMEYGILVLPQQETMRPEVLKKIAGMVKQGLTIVGVPPTHSPSLANYPEADKQIAQLASRVWSEEGYGKGRVFRPGESLDEVLKALQIPADCRIEGDAPVLFIHRTTKEGEIYFLSNQSNAPVSFNATFRVAGKMPELWNPLTEEMRYLPEYRCSEGLTSVPLQLDGQESAFVIFRKEDGSQSLQGANYPAETTLGTLEGEWEVSFGKGYHAPQHPVTFPTLTDWRESQDPDIKYYSGTAVYTKNFRVEKPSGKQIYLDLGNVAVMAKVYVNGKYAGGVWTAPYRVNITPLLQEGDNSLRIEVVNTWVNRLIGDQKLPEEERLTWTLFSPWNAESELQPSGLLGPVTLKAYGYLPVE